MGRALVTDLYELAMAASYLRRGMVGEATFSLFVRALPPERGFLVAAGLEDCLEYLEDLRLDDGDLVHLARSDDFDAEDLERLATLRFTGDVWAVPEGRVVGPGEPLLEVTAPLPEAQLVETYLLNQATYQTALAAKAARYRLAAGEGVALVDFALRRTHGVEASMAVARVSAMAGFVATSNVEAARRFGLRSAGTMAHSYVQSFPTEADAFRAHVLDRPPPYTFLVDTYDTLAGVRTAIEVIGELDPDGPLAVRLDSGDFAALASETRRLLDDAGLGQVRVFVSGGLDELDVDRLVRAGAPVDAMGIGTRLGVSADAPALESVYKLVSYGGRPVIKRSPGKATTPGAKQVFRLDGGRGDVLALREEAPPTGAEPLLEPVLRQGRRLRPPPPLDDARSRLAADLEWLPGPSRALEAPAPFPVTLSDRLRQLRAAVEAELGHPGG